MDMYDTVDEYNRLTMPDESFFNTVKEQTCCDIGDHFKSAAKVHTMNLLRQNSTKEQQSDPDQAIRILADILSVESLSIHLTDHLPDKLKLTVAGVYVRSVTAKLSYEAANELNEKVDSGEISPDISNDKESAMMEYSKIMNKLSEKSRAFTMKGCALSIFSPTIAIVYNQKYGDKIVSVSPADGNVVNDNAIDTIDNIYDKSLSDLEDPITFHLFLKVPGQENGNIDTRYIVFSLNHNENTPLFPGYSGVHIETLTKNDNLKKDLDVLTVFNVLITSIFDEFKPVIIANRSNLHFSNGEINQLFDDKTYTYGNLESILTNILYKTSTHGGQSLSKKGKVTSMVNDCKVIKPENMMYGVVSTRENFDHFSHELYLKNNSSPFSVEYYLKSHYCQDILFNPFYYRDIKHKCTFMVSGHELDAKDIRIGSNACVLHVNVDARKKKEYGKISKFATINGILLPKVNFKNTSFTDSFRVKVFAMTITRTLTLLNRTMLTLILPDPNSLAVQLSGALTSSQQLSIGDIKRFIDIFTKDDYSLYPSVSIKKSEDIGQDGIIFKDGFTKLPFLRIIFSMNSQELTA